jgi:nicotinate phosphoribosyltransferase
MPATAENYELLVPALRGGQRVSEPEALAAIRDRALGQLSRLPEGVRRFLNPHEFPVGIDVGLHDAREKMIQQMRASSSRAKE